MSLCRRILILLTVLSLLCLFVPSGAEEADSFVAPEELAGEAAEIEAAMEAEEAADGAAEIVDDVKEALE